MMLYFTTSNNITIPRSCSKIRHHTLMPHRHTTPSENKL